jgi:hypothetical protein
VQPAGTLQLHFASIEHGLNTSADSDDYIQLRIRRGIFLAFIGSLIVHLLVLFAIPHKLIETGDGAAANGPISVVLKPPGRKPAAAAEAERPPPPKRLASRPKNQTPPIITTTRPSANAPVVARPVAPPEPVAEPPADLQAFVEAARAKRRQSGSSYSGESSAGSGGPSEEEVRMANVMRNLRPGTNGVFQILSMSTRSAAFTFRGWTTDVNNARREYISVEVGSHPSIELAVVRKMIELIRRYYKGNFNWESQRLDRVVTLSARLEDTDGLEDFLIREFFAAPAQRAPFR